MVDKDRRRQMKVGVREDIPERRTPSWRPTTQRPSPLATFNGPQVSLMGGGGRECLCP